jgi:hypothetical protein
LSQCPRHKSCLTQYGAYQRNRERAQCNMEAVAHRDVQQSVCTSDWLDLLYSILDPRSRDIRILTLLPGAFSDPIVCRMNTIKLDEAKYNTLSYVWGDPNCCQKIKVNSHLVEVTRSLFLALRCLRKPAGERILWVDAICINQADTRDKSNQVSMIGEIYRRSQET